MWKRWIWTYFACRSSQLRCLVLLICILILTCVMITINKTQLTLSELARDKISDFCLFDIRECTQRKDAHMLFGRRKSRQEIIATHSDVSNGSWKPDECTNKHKVAIIIPYRDRETQVDSLLQSLIPVLKFQRVAFTLFLVEQMPGVVFNKGMLMNAGVKETLKYSERFDCFIFHDVDMIPENKCNYYTCLDEPLHLGVYVNKFKYRLPYKGLVGGVLALSRDVLLTVNGFSNLLYGWGDEDDNMSERIKFRGYSLMRYGGDVSRYAMLEHNHDWSNPHRARRFYDARESMRYLKLDGLSNVDYSVTFQKITSLFVHIGIELQGPSLGSQIFPTYHEAIENLERRFRDDLHWQMEYAMLEKNTAHISLNCVTVD